MASFNTNKVISSNSKYLFFKKEIGLFLLFSHPMHHCHNKTGINYSSARYRSSDMLQISEKQADSVPPLCTLSPTTSTDYSSALYNSTL
jgi:hypothetical protein